MEQNGTYSWTPNQDTPPKKPDFKKAGRLVLIIALVFVLLIPQVSPPTIFLLQFLLNILESWQFLQTLCLQVSLPLPFLSGNSQPFLRFISRFTPWKAFLPFLPPPLSPGFDCVTKFLCFSLRGFTSRFC